MATIDATGVAGRDLAGYRQLLEARFRAQFGADLDLAPETVQGGIIAVMALSLAEEDESLVAEAAAMSQATAVGVQLDDLGTLLGVARRAATRSTVMVTLTGAVDTVVPAGSRVRTTGGVRFRLLEDATIGSAGTVDAGFEAVDTGPVAAAAGSLTEIETLVAGWDAATNAAAAVVGRDEQTDANYREHLRARAGRNTVHTVDALYGALFDAGCSRALVEANDTDTPSVKQGLTVQPRSVLCIVEGGLNDDIAQAILSRKPPGVGMSGAVSVGGAQFTRVAAVPFKVAVTLTTGAGFPADGADQIKDALVRYVAGEWSGGAGQFQTGGFGVGEGPDTNRLLVPVQSVPGHTVSAIAVTDSAGAALPATTPLNRRYTLAKGDISISVS